MPKNFRDLTATKRPAWHVAVEAQKRQLLSEVPLRELRRVQELFQERVADGASREPAGDLRHETNQRVSTLRRAVEAMGIKMEIISQSLMARFRKIHDDI